MNVLSDPSIPLEVRQNFKRVLIDLTRLPFIGKFEPLSDKSMIFMARSPSVELSVTLIHPLGASKRFKAYVLTYVHKYIESASALDNYHRKIVHALADWKFDDDYISQQPTDLPTSVVEVLL